MMTLDTLTTVPTLMRSRPFKLAAMPFYYNASKNLNGGVVVLNIPSRGKWIFLDFFCKPWKDLHPLRILQNAVLFRICKCSHIIKNCLVVCFFLMDLNMCCLSATLLTLETCFDNKSLWLFYYCESFMVCPPAEGRTQEGRMNFKQ